MKKNALLLGLMALLFTSCVTLGKYEELESRNNLNKKNLAVAKTELGEMKAENAELLRQNQSLSAEMQEMLSRSAARRAENDSLRRQLDRLQHQYDTTIENYMQQVAGKNRDLIKTNDMLTARTKELEQKEAALKQKEADLQSQQRTYQQRQMELEIRQQELEKQENAARTALAAKERELENVRNSVNKALTGFANKGLNVETKDGKVYVSMESKLMFASASWEVSKEGVQAIKELAKVLESNPDLNILVEGHTDNDAYKGSTAVKDNWDLSVMRATSIVKLLLQHGPKIDPARIEACGHGEFAPKVENNSAANKAQNRRTEIILTPNLGDILNIVK